MANNLTKPGVNFIDKIRTACKCMTFYTDFVTISDFFAAVSKLKFDSLQLSQQRNGSMKCSISGEWPIRYQFIFAI